MEEDQYECVALKNGSKYFIIIEINDNNIMAVGPDGKIPKLDLKQVMQDENDEPIVYQISSDKLTDEQKKTICTRLLNCKLKSLQKKFIVQVVMNFI